MGSFPDTGKDLFLTNSEIKWYVGKWKTSFPLSQAYKDLGHKRVSPFIKCSSLETFYRTGRKRRVNEKGTEVLQQYDLDIIRTSRVRGAILCETRQGCHLLKEYNGTESRMEQVQQVLSQLEEITGVAVDRAVRNREGVWISKDNDQIPYVVKAWNNGRECDLLEEIHVLRGVRLLASLHSGLRQIDSTGFSQEDDVQKEFSRHNAEMRRARTFVRKVHHKSEFELAMIQSFTGFYQQAQEALRLLEQWEQEKKGAELRQQSHGYLCHGEYSHHHILYDGQFAMVTDFMAMTRGVQVADLYYFMRKAMEKQGFDCRIGHRMLEEYDRYLPLTKEDRRYLYIRFLYPEKYWKQINYYYNSNKAWIPARNTEKIYMLQELEPERQKFLDFLGQGGVY